MARRDSLFLEQTDSQLILVWQANMPAIAAIGLKSIPGTPLAGKLFLGEDGR
ncbi:MAG: hypothetical protein ACJAZW_001666 [Maritalea sp.]|jgi:hypothetical protein